MHHVIRKIYSPAGEQLDSDSIAEFATYSEAAAMVEKLTSEDIACPPNADENRCEYHVDSE
jgi:hypothetical protein